MANPDSITQLFAILGIGFFLGMRHASDPDHVIAVSTIVTREQRLGQPLAVLRTNPDGA
jgi:high-affinity nickel permease